MAWRDRAATTGGMVGRPVQIPDRCLSVEDVALYVGGGVASQMISPLVQHVETCEACRRSVAAAVRAARSSAPHVPAGDDGAGIEIGTPIGRYVVRAARGTGAMSHVYEASDPDLGRTIALKIVRHHDADGDARALREGRALARLAHPNVVAVHDVGVWSGGVFLAIELARGSTVREWGATPRSPREIARVFAAAARGLAAAHREGLVHRDVKPDNLVVDDDGRVRVIDFGLAIDDAEDAPAFGGTPAYLAPEQRTTRSADARSDQYAFAISLYEMLEGERPSATPPTWRGRAPAWLRAIVDRATSTDPKQRYADMDAVARALERGLGANRRRAIAAAAAAAILGAGGVIAYEVTREPAGPVPCTGAGEQIATAWSPARKQAIATAFAATGKPYAADASQAVARRLDTYATEWTKMHADTCEATHVRGEQSAELLDLRMSCLRTRLVEMRTLVDLFAQADAQLVGRARSAAGALASLGDCADTQQLTETVRPPSDPAGRARADALADRVAAARAMFDAAKVDAALAASKQIVEEARALGHAPTLASALFMLATSQHRSGDLKAAEPTLRETARVAESGRADHIKADALLVLLWTVGDTPDRLAEAVAIAEDARATLLRLGDDREREGRRLDNLGIVYRMAGKHAEALDAHQRALAIREKLLEADDPGLANTVNNVGAVLFDLGKNDEALPYFERARGMWERSLGTSHPQVATADNNIASVYWMRGEMVRAIEIHERALAIRRSALGPEHPDTGVSVFNLAEVMRDLGRWADSLARFEEARGIFEKSFGPKHPLYAKATEMVGAVLTELDRFADARPLLDAALALKLEVYGADHNEVALVRASLGEWHLRQNQHADAAKHFREALRIDEKVFGAESSNLVDTLHGLARAELAAGRTAASLALAERALKLAEAGGLSATALAETRFLVARAAWSSDRGRARALAESARDAYAKLAPSPRNDRERAEIASWLAAH